MRRIDTRFVCESRMCYHLQLVGEATRQTSVFSQGSMMSIRENNSMPADVHVVDATIAQDAERFRKLGTVKSLDVVVEISAMCNGNQQIVSEISNRSGLGQIEKLIFYGHAAPGIMNTAAGKSPSGVKENSGFGAECRPGAVCDRNHWRSIKPYFSQKGCVVLKGCNVAQGTAGKSLLRQLSEAFGVPVFGSDWYQATGVSYLVGNVAVAYPDGRFEEESANQNGGLMRLFKDDPMAAMAVGLFELLYDPD